MGWYVQAENQSALLYRAFRSLCLRVRLHVCVFEVESALVRLTTSTLSA